MQHWVSQCLKPCLLLDAGACMMCQGCLGRAIHSAGAPWDLLGLSVVPQHKLKPTGSKQSGGSNPTPLPLLSLELSTEQSKGAHGEHCPLQSRPRPCLWASEGSAPAVSVLINPHIKGELPNILQSSCCLLQCEGQAMQCRASVGSPGWAGEGL